MIEKAKLILRNIWTEVTHSKLLAVAFISTAILGLLLLFAIILLANQPSYEPGGLETDNNLLELNNQYIALQSNYEKLAFDYNNVRGTLVSTVYDLEASKQFAIAYETAFNELTQSYQAMSVANQLLEASHKGLSQASDVSKEFSQQYDALVILHKEKSEQYSDLLKKIDEVSDREFFVVTDNFTLTDNFTQTDMDSFYSGWDFWVESLEDEE